ncbi:DMT family transporter [Streptococcus mutans]|uniref:DMT family transporter n=1 Tax=Streptococcus mutans TaxID=1309 RepID=UPI00066EF36A|nr:DMT family transporter [Streptococcus mutans]MCY7115580.1 DMT family transporter [Streptococcus mutans]QIQ94522.1 DMT family transporter [Streptococcus mutans]QIR00760.1 DMT family transporter [Streptococcus mutans]QIR02411.1 DMT family transporter [Streptococcus mutans]QIR04541.1 DMT family transporter [Streptococcus mutans]
MKNSFSRGVLSCLIAGLLFGAQWPIAGSALTIIDPYWFTLIRYIIVAIILSAILFLKEGKKGFVVKKGQLLIVFFLGTMAFCAYNFLVFAGQKIAGTQGTILASLLMALIPMISVLVLWGYKKEFPGWLTITFIVISLLGVVLVVTKGNFLIFQQQSNLLFPILLIFFSVFAWVFYTIGGSSFPNWSSLKYTTLSCILGNISSIFVIIFLTKMHISQAPLLADIQSIKWQLLYMSIFSGVIGVLMWNVGNRILTPKNGSLFMNLVPIVTFVIEVFSGYKISKIEILGALLTISAIVLNNLISRFSIKNN